MISSTVSTVRIVAMRVSSRAISPWYVTQPTAVTITNPARTGNESPGMNRNAKTVASSVAAEAPTASLEPSVPSLPNNVC